MRRSAFAIAVLILTVPGAGHAYERWVGAGSLADGRALHTSAVLRDGRVMVTGGRGCPVAGRVSTGFSSSEVYDPASGKWSADRSMVVPRDRQAMALLQDGRVLVSGGQATVGACQARVHLPLDSAEAYDAVNGWSLTGTMSIERVEHTLTTLNDGRVLAAGGANESTEVFDPRTGAWSAVGSLTFERSSHTATLLVDGRVLVAGGVPFSTEIFDPSTDRWQVAASMNEARAGHSATLLPDGRVLVAGGFGTTAAEASTEIYDPLADTWTPAARMIAVRAAHSATLLAGGAVLVAGGYDGRKDFATAEIYDPVLDRWRAAPSMANIRGEHIAERLADASVLVAGGYVGTEQFTASAELFLAG